MWITLNEQLRDLLIAVLSGAGAGMIVDLFLYVRPSGAIPGVIGRILLSVSLFVWLWVTSMLTAMGIGLVFFFGAAAGACFYHSLIRAPIRPLYDFVWKHIQQKFQKPGSEGHKNERI